MDHEEPVQSSYVPERADRPQTRGEQSGTIFFDGASPSENPDSGWRWFDDTELPMEGRGWSVEVTLPESYIHPKCRS
jgi:hypothetical protein